MLKGILPPLLAVLAALLAAQEPPPGPGKKAEANPPAPAPLTPAPGVPVVETIAGPLQGPVSFAGGEGRAASLKIGPATVPIEDLLFIRFAERSAAAGPAILYLKGGDELRATIRGGDEGELHVECYAVRPTGGGSLRIPLEELRGIAFPREVGGGKGIKVRRWLLGGHGPRAPRAAGGDPPRDGEAEARKEQEDEEDRVLLDEGAELRGTLVKIDAAAVHFQSGAAGEVKLSLDKVQAVSIAAIVGGKKREGEGGQAAGRAGGPGPIVAAEAHDESSVSGRLLLLDEHGPRIATAELGEVTVPIDRLRSLGFRGGRCQYLSDLEPAKVTYRDDLFTPWELKRDLAATGDPIRLRGREYRKGLGMHSYCRADYALDGRFSRFQAVIGMDDRAQPESSDAQRAGGGTAVFRVLVDGRVVLEKELAWSDPACPIDIPLDGAKVLGLELDHGPGFLILDRGDWAEARIIKK